MDTKMLRLCLTLSVLLGLQITATGADQEVIDFCHEVYCLEPLSFTSHGTYEENEFPTLQWVVTEVSGMDMKNAVITGMDKLLKYSYFSNAAATIVPVSAPWVIQGHLVDGTVQQKFNVSLNLPPLIISPPEPTDPTVKIIKESSLHYFIRTFHDKTDVQNHGSLVKEFMKDLEDGQRSFYKSSFFIAWTFRHHNQDLGSLINEFIKDLDQDKRSFYRKFFYIGWFNTRGLKQIAFVKK
ncbi:uncharacterized protein [Heptranchias perlo]|uniref:uncharacterized protein n=1 Tax=Heptranchias perlo TaxID=212740 RepID=UPI00355A5823